MTELGPDGRSLFASARQGLAPSAEDSARNERRLAARLGTAALAATGSAGLDQLATAKSGWAAALGVSGRSLLKWSALGLAVVIGAAVALAPRAAPKIVAASASRSGVASSTSVLTTPVPVTPPPPLVPFASGAEASSGSPPRNDEQLAVSRPAARDFAKSLRPSPPLGAPRAGLAEESRLLRSADAALREGDLLRALALLDEHAQRFPRGVLAEERSSERISTLCKLGRVADAQLEFQRFDWSNSDSPLASAARSSCVK